MNYRRHDCNRRYSLAAFSLLGALSVGASGSVAAEPGSTAAVPAGAPAAPRLEVEAKSIDLGQLVRGQVAKADFVIRNAGDAVLKIESAKPG